MVLLKASVKILFVSFFLMSTLLASINVVDKEVKPYLLPDSHRLKPALDEIFSQGRPTYNHASLQQAGFQVLYEGKRSYIIVARHDQLPGYLVKLYLDSETRIKRRVAGWKWLLRRCQGAKAIREVIKEKHIKHFSVPKKWLYALPGSDQSPQPFILLVQDMQLVSEYENRLAWKSLMTKEHLDELFEILKKAKGSSYRQDNIWYSKNGTFALIDTEYPYRRPNYQKVRHYFLPDLARYWDQLILPEASQ